MWTPNYEMRYWLETGLSKGTYIYANYYNALNLMSYDFTNSIVADIGCGPFGGLSSCIKCKNYIPVDILADKYNKLARTPVKIIHGDLQKRLPLDDASCDYVICTNAVDHVRKIRHAISELSRILRLGGSLFLHVHLRTKKQINKAHIHVLTENKVQSLLQCAGLSIDEMHVDTDWVNDNLGRKAVYLKASK